MKPTLTPREEAYQRIIAEAEAQISKVVNRPAPRTRAQAAQITRAFNDAAQNYAFKGAQHPDVWEDMDAQFERARQRLINHLMQ